MTNLPSIWLSNNSDQVLTFTTTKPGYQVSFFEEQNFLMLKEDIFEAISIQNAENSISQKAFAFSDVSQI